MDTKEENIQKRVSAIVHEGEDDARKHSFDDDYSYDVQKYIYLTISSKKCRVCPQDQTN